MKKIKATYMNIKFALKKGYLVILKSESGLFCIVFSIKKRKILQHAYKNEQKKLIHSYWENTRKQTYNSLISGRTYESSFAKNDETNIGSNIIEYIPFLATQRSLRHI